MAKTLPILLICLAGTLLFHCSSPKEKVDLSPQLNKWLDEQYEELLLQSPLELTALGRKDLYDQIDDMSEEAEDKRLAWMEGSVKEMQEQFAKDELNSSAQVSYDLWLYQYEMAKEAAEFRHMPYIFNQMTGLHTQLPNILINYHKVDEPEDMGALISRLGETGRAIRQLLERAKLQADAGIRPPKFAYEIVIPQVKAMVTGLPFDSGKNGSPLWNDAMAKIDSLEQSGKISESEASEFRESTATTLKEKFQPAYEEEFKSSRT